MSWWPAAITPPASLATAAVIDPATGQVFPAASMSTRRAGVAGVALLDGRVLILGGWGADGASLDTAEVYVPASAAKSSP